MKNVRDFLSCDYDIFISGITDDSRKVKKDYLFVATKGYYVDHYNCIDDAIKRGCSFIVADREIKKIFPHIIVENINSFYQKLCIKFYDIDLSSFYSIGITGTDGKTTTASIVKELIDDCAYIGTNGLIFKDQIITIDNTTPCISELCEYLTLVQKECVPNISMEVSSEALLHDRIQGFLFDIVAFTNVTGDHLNIHKSFDNYLNCKLKLLQYLKPNGVVVINGDDPYLKNISCPHRYSFGFHRDNDYVIKHVDYNAITEITILHCDKEYHIKTVLKGVHNVYNIVLAFIIGLLYGIDENTLIQKISRIQKISGRCEFLDFGQDYDIVLDYAHTINGIRNILDTFKDYSRIITVTGCAGGRDQEKRSTIGKIVMDCSDISIFTMDDPRNERVDEVIDQMVGDRTDYIRIPNRVNAICYALDMAVKGDVVLILGKGRDHYMAIGDEKIIYCDFDVIHSYFT